MEKESEISHRSFLDDNSIVLYNTEKHLVAADTTMEDLKVKLNSMMDRVDDGENLWRCSVCGKTNKGKDRAIARQDMRRHIETHIDGLSYPCNKCDKISRSSNALNVHISKMHIK